MIEKIFDSLSKEWASRQISTAYDEHATLIQSLEAEVNEAKIREEALLNEFAQRFRSLASFSNPTSLTKGNDDADMTDMPMDELADTARMERNARNLEKLEQQKMMDEIRRQAEKEMNKLREENQKQIKFIQESLKEKVAEIEQIRKESLRIEAERLYYKEKQVSGSTSTFVTVPPSPTSSSGSELSSEPPALGRSPSLNSATPISRIRKGSSFTKLTQSGGKSTLLIPSQQVPTLITPNDDGSPVSVLTADNKSPNKLSQIDAEGESSEKRNGQLFKSLQHPSSAPRSISEGNCNYPKASNHSFSSDSLERLSYAIDNIISPRKGTTGNHAALSETEQRIIDKVKIAIHAAQKKQRKTIADLKSQLEDASHPMNDELENEYLNIISELENELDSANKSIKNTSNLEALVGMLNGNKNISYEEHTDLLEEYAKLENERNELLQEKTQMKEEHDQSLQALQRYVADLTEDRDKNIGLLEGRIKELEDADRPFDQKENIPIKQNFDNPKTNISDNKDLTNKCLEMEQELTKAWEEAEESKAFIETLEKNMKAEIENLKHQLHHNNNAELVEKLSLGIEEATQDIHNLEKELSETKQKALELEVSNEKLQNLLSAAKEPNEEYTLEVEKKMSGLNQENDTLRAEVESLKGDNTILSEKYSALEKKYEDTESLLKSIRNGIKKLDIPKAQLLPDLISQEVTIGNLINEQKSIVGALEEASDTINRLEKEKKEITEKYECVRNEMENVKEELAQTHTLVLELEDDYEKVQIANASFDDQQKSMHNLILDIKSCHAREQALEDELSDLRLLMDKIMKGNSSTKNELQNTVKQLTLDCDGYKKSIRLLEDKNSLLDDELNEMRSQLVIEESNCQPKIIAGGTLSSLATLKQIIEKRIEVDESDSTTSLRQKLMVIDQANAKLERMLQKQIKSDGVEDNIHDEKECGILLDNIATILTTFMGQEPKPSELSNINPDMKLRRLEDIMQAQKLENDFLRMEVNDLKSERDMELILLNSEKARLEEKCTSNARLLADKDRQMANQEKELEILRESLKATTAGYISGDDSFSETDSYVCDSYVSGANKRDDTNGGRKVYSPPRDKYTSLVEAKEKAEIDAKTNSDNLETAKKIISSLEESHKKTTQDLKTRLHSSNETIASLLDISNKFEKETADLKAEIKMFREAEGKRQEETSRLSNLIPKNDDSLPGLT